MKFYIKETGETKEVTLKQWNGNGYNPDCFMDMETNFALNRKTLDGGEEYICTSEEYTDLVEWWEKEIELWGLGTNHEGDDLSECNYKDFFVFAD